MLAADLQAVVHGRRDASLVAAETMQRVVASFMGKIPSLLAAADQRRTTQMSLCSYLEIGTLASLRARLTLAGIFCELSFDNEITLPAKHRASVEIRRNQSFNGNEAVN
jgi:hypothetical protein